MKWRKALARHNINDGVDRSDSDSVMFGTRFVTKRAYRESDRVAYGSDGDSRA